MLAFIVVKGGPVQDSWLDREVERDSKEAREKGK